MSLPSWPGGCPPTLIVDNAQHTHRPKVVMQQPDTGPRMQRQRFSGVYELWVGFMWMTAAQWATAQSFYHNTLAGGSLPFNFTHPITGATVQATFLSDDPQSLCVYQLEGVKLKIGFKLELGPLTV